MVESIRMQIVTEKLAQFFDQIKTLTFWKRLFGWGYILSLSYDAFQEFKSLVDGMERTTAKINPLENEISLLKTERDHLKSTQSKHDSDVTILREKVHSLEKENSDLRRENTIFKQEEQNRKKQHDTQTSTLATITAGIQESRNKEIEERQRAELERLARMKETWLKHQENVKELIKMICQKHTVEYVDSVPFKGAPDNTIKIADEFIIFDAKSPASDDLTNFPSYIKAQTEQAKKYIKQENVKKDIFLVIPSNTVDTISPKFCYNLADYNVYIVTVDSLEPLILGLKRLEEYEFIKELSPEERDNISRVIGKFVHLTKRRIQIDQFFDRTFIELLLKTEGDLPHEILEKVAEYERSEKLNPPSDKRAKIIPIELLQIDSDKIKKEAEVKSIAFPSEVDAVIESLPLHTADEPLKKIARVAKGK